MERDLGGMEKIVIDQSGQGSGFVPYLPLTEMQRRPQGGPGQTQGATR